jgi:hypothetical protein
MRCQTSLTCADYGFGPLGLAKAILANRKQQFDERDRDHPPAMPSSAYVTNSNRGCRQFVNRTGA